MCYGRRIRLASWHQKKLWTLVSGRYCPAKTGGPDRGPIQSPPLLFCSPARLSLARGSGGSAVSYLSGFWGRDLAEIEFGAFYPWNLTSGGNSLKSFPGNWLTEFRENCYNEQRCIMVLAHGTELYRFSQQKRLCVPITKVAECLCKTHQRYPEIRPRTVMTNAPWFTLAWHSWASQLWTLSTDTSMSSRESSSVPVGLLHNSIPSCTTAPAFSRSSLAGGSATSAQHVRPSGIRCRWPDDLQRSARWAARPHRQHNNFQMTFKDTFFSTYLHV